MTNLEHFSAAHRLIVQAVAREAGIAEPVAFTAGPYYWPLLKFARRKRALPIDGVLVRDWSPGARKVYPGLRLGARLYEIDGIRFVTVQFTFNFEADDASQNFMVVDAANYARLFRLAIRSERECEPPSPPPILPPEQAEILWKNTIGYLERENLEGIQRYGGRARRGVLLTGDPGNGKTMACRWIWEECRRRSWEWRAVTPSIYRSARQSCDAEACVRQLFSVQRRGVIFFDDMDLALRDRDTVGETEDQSIFLTALDGIGIKEGVVYVFTTNCDLSLIDRAFKRPGRIDVVLHFQPPDARLRRELLERWHADIRARLCMETAVATTKGLSFAEIEELKNLLIMHFSDTGDWDWDWALRQFDLNREEFHARRHVGFGAMIGGNGHDG